MYANLIHIQILNGMPKIIEDGSAVPCTTAGSSGR